MFLLLSTLLASAPVMAVPMADTGITISGVKLPATVEVSGTPLALNGGALRKKMIFKVYVAGLYLAKTSKSADEILAADAPRQMALHFISGHGTKDKMCGAWNEGLEANTPAASAGLKKQFAELCEMMVDTKDGDLMTLTYVPGSGTTVAISGTDRGIVQGKEFADAVLRCWIGAKPGPGEGFKKGVLGAS